MHDIAYIYSNNSNRLDTITADGIKSSRYGYDGIGNLTRDGGEDFDVSWTSFNKVKSVAGNGRNLTFGYSSLGQRQIKRSGTVSEYYIHDAVGNVLAVYRHDLRQEGFYVTERSIYGSSRIGILGSNLRTIPFMPFYSWRHSRVMGQRSYELTDHLGNVATVISDRKFAVGPTGFVVYYIPEIRSYTDYYPFGFPIEERTGVGGVRTRGYRYGFNGQEKDDEIYGEGASYTAEFWQYDSRLGRRWNVDPVTKPWESPYATFGGNPIWFVDPDGRDFDPVVDEENKTITITAVYYTSDENKDRLQTALNAWNDQSGKYSYTTGEGDKQKTYAINFNLIIAEGEHPTMDDAVKAFSSDGKSNFYQITKIGNPDVRGETDGRNIRVDPVRGLARTDIHEIGHTLGIGEGSGVMASGEKSTRITKTHVATILERSGMRVFGNFFGNMEQKQEAEPLNTYNMSGEVSKTKRK